VTGVDAATTPDDPQSSGFATLPSQVLHNFLTPAGHDAPDGPGRPLVQDARFWERGSVHTAAPSADVTLDRRVPEKCAPPAATAA
jgi:hypothetical protein